jgi:acetolactate synthase-1/2/3 large subunit
MADGFARVSGTLGVVLVTSGPGATNALTGAMNAQASGVPVLTISGEVKEAYFGLGYLQEGIDAVLDVNAVYRAAVGYTTFIDNPANFRVLFETALREALTAPAGAVHVGIPADVQGQPVPAPVTFPRSTSNYRTVPRGSDPAAVQQARDFLLVAERPLIFLGNGARRALQDPDRAAAFAALVERFSIPVMTTPEAKGIFPESHPLSLRNYGLAGSQWTTAYMLGPPQYDALLVIGSALGELAATRTIMPLAPGTQPPPGVGFWSTALLPNGPFMQVDLDHAAIGRAFPVDLGIVADAATALDALVATRDQLPVPSSQPGRLAFIEQVKAAPAEPSFGPPSVPDTVHPAAMVAALSAALPAGSHVFVDCGNCVGWSNAYLTIDPPTQVHEALAMGPMGFAVAGVIGAKLAAPEAACVAVVGDGAFLMQGSEISTAAQQGAGAIWVVLDDGDLTMVSQGQEEFFKGPDWTDYYKIGTNDLVGYSTALGAQGVEVTSIDEFAGAFATALTQSQAGRPQVISVKVDPAAEPPYYPATS